MKKFAFQQVDVFTAVPFKGNPVAVVLDADEIPPEQMQAIARWTNLSETTFVCSRTTGAADYRLRIFTPRQELPFAGHPTIGSAHAALQHGLKSRTAGRLVQECAKGLIHLRIDEDRIWLELPARVHHTPTPDQIAAAAAALGVTRAEVLEADIIDVGPIWFTIRLTDAAHVLSLRPDEQKIAALGPSGLTGVTVFGRYPRGSAADFEVRSFAPAHGITEDPVCGSGNGCVAAMVQRSPHPPRHYVAS